MKHFLLIYELAPDYMTRRAQFRNEHLRLAWAAAERGEMILGGALGDPPDRGTFLFRSADKTTAEAFVRADPYVTNGLVTSWQIQPWTTVVGETAIAPVRPS